MKNTIDTEQEFINIRDNTIHVVLPAGWAVTFEFNDGIQTSAEINCQYKYRRAVVKIKEKEMYGKSIFQVRHMLIHEVCHIWLGAQKHIFDSIQQDIGNFVRSTVRDHMLYVEEQMCEEMSVRFHRAYWPDEFYENAYNYGLCYTKYQCSDTHS